MSKNTWMTLSETLTALGISERTLRRRVASGEIQKAPWTGPNGTCYYWVPEDEPVRGDGKPVRGSESPPYVYDEGLDVYVFSKTSGGRVALPGEDVRTLWERYTAGQESLTEVSRKLGLDKRTVQEIKRALDLTRSSAPFTREELEDSEDEVLVDQALAARERAIMAKVERKEHETLRENAGKWSALHKSLREAFDDFDLEPLPQVPRKKVTSIPESKYLLVVGTTDLHVGKRPFKGQAAKPWDYFQICHKAIQDAVSWWGLPERIVVIVGSDLCHVDTWKYTTSRGTFQGTTGSVSDIVRDATQVMGWVIQAAVELAPVDALWIPGNHDEVLSFAVALALEKQFENNPDVRLDLSQDHRKILSYGDVPILFHHGHELKAERAPALLAAAMPSGCDIRKGVVIQGHLHINQRKVNSIEGEFGGIQTLTLTSPSSHDEWHHGEGYDLTAQRLSVIKITSRGYSGMGISHMENDK